MDISSIMIDGLANAPLYHQTTIALVRFDERVAGMGTLSTPAVNALTALEAARSAGLDGVRCAAKPIATSLCDRSTRTHPAARLVRGIAAARGHHSARPAAVLESIHAAITPSPVHAGRLRMHTIDQQPPLPAPPAPTVIGTHLTELDTFIESHREAAPIATAATAYALTNLIHPYESGTGQAARALTTHLLAKANLTTTIPAPIGTGLTCETHQQILAAVNGGDTSTAAAIFAHAILQGISQAATFINDLVAETAAMRAILSDSRTRTDSLAWNIADQLIGHPVTHSSHAGALAGSDRFAGYKAVNRLSATGILTADGDIHTADRIAKIWDTAIAASA